MSLISLLILILAGLALLAVFALSIILLEESGGGSAFWALLVIVIATLLFVPLSSQIDDTTTIVTSERFIAVEEEALESIDEEMNKITQALQNGTLMNADTPVASYVKEKSLRVSAIRDIKREVEEARLNILRREMGFAQWTTWIIKHKEGETND